MGAHNSVVGADQGFRAPSWDLWVPKIVSWLVRRPGRFVSRESPQPLMTRGFGHGTCGCPKSCRGWSGGLFVFVDEAIAAGRSDESKGQRVVSRVVVGGGVSGRSLA